MTWIAIYSSTIGDKNLTTGVMAHGRRAKNEYEVSVYVLGLNYPQSII